MGRFSEVGGGYPIADKTYGEMNEAEELPYILNLTQHKATDEQIETGVHDVGEKYAVRLTELLTFSELPSEKDVEKRADAIVELVHDIDIARNHVISRCMIGGAPYLMCPLEKRLRKRMILPVYAFSQRVSEEKEVDGKVIKIQVFKHLGFVEATG